ncbi:unnamed protein product, partial [Amoebophrya sp. A120]|eukprot:GSA120T00021444001.1
MGAKLRPTAVRRRTRPQFWQAWPHICRRFSAARNRGKREEANGDCTSGSSRCVSIHPSTLDPPSWWYQPVYTCETCSPPCRDYNSWCGVAPDHSSGKRGVAPDHSSGKLGLASAEGFQLHGAEESERRQTETALVLLVVFRFVLLRPRLVCGTSRYTYSKLARLRRLVAIFTAAGAPCLLVPSDLVFLLRNHVKNAFQSHFWYTMGNKILVFNSFRLSAKKFKVLFASRKLLIFTTCCIFIMSVRKLFQQSHWLLYLNLCLTASSSCCRRQREEMDSLLVLRILP